MVDTINSKKKVTQRRISGEKPLIVLTDVLG